MNGTEIVNKGEGNFQFLISFSAKFDYTKLLVLTEKLYCYN